MNEESTPWSLHIRHFRFRTSGTKTNRVDPVGIDAIIDAPVWLDPMPSISPIWLLRAEAAINVDLRTPAPKSLDCGAEPLQQPSTTGRETEALPDLVNVAR
jgi:hypothetical protein